MVSGQGYARVERITARNAAIEDEGGCSYCTPHGGENLGRHGRRDARYIRGVGYVPSKGKDRK